jgi:hypothetical protein
MNVSLVVFLIIIILSFIVYFVKRKNKITQLSLVDNELSKQQAIIENKITNVKDQIKQTELDQVKLTPQEIEDFWKDKDGK